MTLPTTAELIAAIDRSLAELAGIPDFDEPLSVLDKLIDAEVALGRAKKELQDLADYQAGRITYNNLLARRRS